MSRHTESTAPGVPALHLQRGIWFTERSGIAAGAFHLALIIRFTGPLDVSALRAACAAVVRRHDVLGMAAAEDGGDLTLVPAANQPALVCREYTDTVCRDSVEQPFDLRHGPLVRFVLTAPSADRHILIVAAHHLVFDGGSKEILARDLAAAYNAAAGPAAGEVIVDCRPANREVDRPHSDREVGPPAYREAARAQRRPEAEQLEQAKQFWHHHWHEPNETLLPGFIRTTQAIESADVQESVIDPALVAAADRAAAAIGVTRFELLLTAVHVLLRRYGNPAGVVAVDVSTRVPETRHSIGPYVNELPVVAPAAPHRPSFREYALAVRAQVRRLYQTRGVAVALAVPGLRPRAALAPVSLSYQQRGDDPEFAGVETEIVWFVPAPDTRNLLQIHVWNRSPNLAVAIQYGRSAVEPGAVSQIHAHLRNLLRAATSDVDRPVDLLSIMDDDEHHRIVVAWNDTNRDYPADATVTSLFRAQARATPGRVAMVDGGRSWTYGQLDVAAGRLAAAIRERGVRPGDLLAVHLERSVDALVAMLAAHRAGAAYVPVDPAYPESRRRLVLADARPALVVTSRSLAEGVRDGAAPVMVVDEAGSGTAGGVDLDPEPAGLAYVIYTSGTTGAPKGAAIPHRALLNLLLSMRAELGSATGEVWLAHTSLSFDISALELFLPLVSGGTVVLASTHEATNAGALLRLIHEHGVTHVQATPSGWRMLLDAGFGKPGTGGGSVIALSGGENLAAELAGELRSRVRRLFNVYGPTETTIWSTLDEVPGLAAGITIGRPVANTQVYVCDADLNPVPAGVPGDLYIGGAGLATGYYGRPGLTAERFVSSPFGPAGARLYRTGDRASRLRDGRIVFHGRSDNQVKIRGHRLELEEIEARLLENPALSAAAVAVRPGPDGQPHLVGYLLLRDSASRPSPAELRAGLGQILPAAAVPTAWIVVHKLPMTPNGKLDRAALPPPGPYDLATPATAEPARTITTTMALLLPMWRDALQLPDVGVESDLFDLGGHSLTVIQLINEIATTFDVEVPLEAFYDRPTVAAIAELIDRTLSIGRRVEPGVPQ